MKNLLHSRVFWLAVLQAVAGIVVMFQTQYPEVGQFAILKSFVDVLLRLDTSKKITI